MSKISQLSVWSRLKLIAFIVLIPFLFVVIVFLATRINSYVCESDACYFISQDYSESMDMSVDPCDDFYQFSCGNWLKNQKVTDDPYVFKGSSTDIERYMIELLESELSYNSSVFQMAVDYYENCTDIETRDSQGVSPLREMLDTLGGWPLITSSWSPVQWEDVYSEIRSTVDLEAVVDLEFWMDAKDPERRLSTFLSPSLMLGPEVFKNPGENRSKLLIDGYKSFVKSMANLLTTDVLNELQVDAEVDQIIYFESQLARIMSSPEEMRDVHKNYNKITVKEMEERYPGTAWLKILRRVCSLENIPINGSTHVIVTDSVFYARVGEVVQNTPNRVIVNYIMTRLVALLGSYTTTAFEDIEFKFKQLKFGLEMQRPLNKTCFDLTFNNYGYILMRLYVDYYVNQTHKIDAELITDQVIDAMQSQVMNSHWLDNETKPKALLKLKSMLITIAYNNWIKNDSALEKHYRNHNLNASTFFGKSVEAEQAYVRYSLNRLPKREKRNETRLKAALDENAYHFRNLNLIYLSVGNLNYPLYASGVPAAVNFGGIGACVGHEVLHGLDDQGKEYNEKGALINWWKQETKEMYQEKTQCYVDQYSNFTEPSTGIKINGRLSLGENIADNAGVIVAYDAYKKYGEKKDKHLPGKMSSYSPRQLFFISYANNWCTFVTKESLRDQLLNDPHAPAPYRVNVPLINSPGFAKAFKCPLGSNMNPKKKCDLW